MGSPVYVELLDNPRYRKFLNQAFPWIGHVRIKHVFMTPFIAAAKDDRVGRSLHKRWPIYWATDCHAQLLSPLCAAGF
jgi:hypothetical protein